MKRYGLLLPHFGPTADRDRLLTNAERAEALGFDSLWVRDHLVYQPHGHEDADITFVESFTTLSAVAARTERITLGFAVLTLFRNPIQTAVLLGSLDFLSGGGRLEIGWGLGGWREQLRLVGLQDAKRGRLLAEQVEVVRELLTGARVDHHGEYASFEGVKISPVPSGPIPIYIAGSGPMAPARAGRYGDGWFPGRIPVWRLEQLMPTLRDKSAEHGRPTPPVTIATFVSPADTIEEGAAHLDIESFTEETARRQGPPPSGSYSSIEDLGGAMIAGPPEEIIRHVRAYQAAGVEQFVFDLRARFEDFEDLLELLGSEVLPVLRAGDTA